MGYDRLREDACFFSIHCNNNKFGCVSGYHTVLASMCTVRWYDRDTAADRKGGLVVEGECSETCWDGSVGGRRC